MNPNPAPSGWRRLYPFESNYMTTAEGHRLHYLDEGQGEAIVMVHGNPTWSFYFRELVKELRTDRRCIVPDHIGCGLSAKPQHWDYRLEQHIANLEQLIDQELGLAKVHLVMHDWGGAIGMGYAVRHPEKIGRMAVLNTGAFHGHPCPLRIRVCRTPWLGAVAVRGFNAFAGMACRMASKAGLDPDVRDGLLYPYDNWNNRIAVHRFVQDIPLSPSHPTWQPLATIQKGLHLLQDHPMLICWGERDFCFTSEFMKTWQQYFPDAELATWPEAGHYVLEDARDEIVPKIAEFLRRQ